MTQLSSWLSSYLYGAAIYGAQQGTASEQVTRLHIGTAEKPPNRQISGHSVYKMSRESVAQNKFSNSLKILRKKCLTGRKILA
tara:strand:+ start:251 stop:499 length:249 start_codon:yes stop_codon:yes gene_type:complete